MREGEGDRVDPIISEEALLLVQQICANVVSYCRVAMTMGGQYLNGYCDS